MPCRTTAAVVLVKRLTWRYNIHIMKIGVFDSGIGGLTIFKQILKKLPQYDYIYFGDTARIPYGNKSHQEIHKLTLEAVKYLIQHNCLLIILACNTATAAALRKIQREYLPRYNPDKRVLGVIRPTVEEIAKNNMTPIGVIGTKATVKSKSFIKEIHKLNPKIKVFQRACPLLVPLIEKKETKTKAFIKILKNYLLPLQQKNIKALILGCTHYGHIKKEIQTIIGKNVKILDEADIIANKLNNYLYRHLEIKNRLSKNKKRQYIFTSKKIKVE